MAGTTESKGAASRRQVASPVPYLEYDEFVEVQIAKTRDSLRSNEVITSLTQLAVLWIGYLLMVVILDQWVADRGLSPPIRMILLLGLIAVSGFITVRNILWPLFRRINPLYAARVIEESESRFQGNLVNWIDLKSAGRASETSAAVRAIEKRAAVGLDRMDVDTAVDRRPLMRAAYALLGVVVLSAMYVAFSPKDPFSSVHRALLPLSATGVSTETTITDITPGNLEVTARSQVTVEADLRGKPVESAQILLTTADRKFVDQPVEMRRIESGLPRFRGVLNGENGRGLLQDVDYRIVANDAQSETFHIRVIQPPSAQIEKLTYNYPAYMQLEPREVPGPAVEAWEGTKVTFEGRTNLPVTQARLILTDTEQGTRGEEISLRIEEGHRLSGSWTLAFRSDGTYPRFYHVAVKTADGSIDPNPVRIPIEIRADQRPEVALLFPTSDLEKPANAIIPLAISASDPDFQLRSLTLKSERNGSPLPDLPLFETEFPTRTIQRTFEWDLGPLGLQPGERLQYWIEARDNRQPVANRTNTPRLSVLVQEPLGTEQQVQRDLADARQQLADDLAATSPNSNPDGEDTPQSAEPTQQESADPNQQPDNQVANRPERGDGDSTESDTNPDRSETNGPDEQTEFQNQLERLLNQEEREHNRPDRPRQDQPTGSAEDEGQRSPSARESEENGESSASAGNSPENGSKSSATNSGPKDKPGTRGQSGRPSSTNKPEEGRENDSADSSPPAESTPAKSTGSQSNGQKSDRGKPQGNSPEKGATPGSQQPEPQADGSDETERSEGSDPAEQPGSRNTRPPTGADQTGSEKKRGERTGTDSTKDSMKERAPQQANKPKSGDDRTAAGRNEQPTAAENDEQQSPEAASRDNQTEKPSKSKSPNPKSPAENRAGSPAADDRNEGDESSEASADDGGEPSGSDQPSQTSEPPSGERPPRPGQASQSQSKQEKSPSPGGKESDDSSNQESQGPGESQQSGKSAGKPAQPQGSQERQSKGNQGGSKSQPGKSDPSGSQSSDSSDQQRSQSEPRGGSKTGPQQTAGKQSSTPSDSSDKETTRKESGESGEPNDGEPPSESGDSPESANSPRKAQGKSTDPATGRRKPKPESATRSGNSQGESSPSEGDSDPQGKQPGESQEHDDPPSERDDSANSAPKQNKRPNNPSEVGNQKPQARGRPQGQQSQQPSAGEQGRSSASDQGESGSHQEGAGESTNQPGDSQPTSQPTGQSQKSPGSGQQGTGQKGTGQQGTNQPKTGQPDSQSGSSKSSPAAKSQDSQSGAGESDADSSDDSGAGSGEDSGDATNGSSPGAGKQKGASGKPQGEAGGAGGADGEASNTPGEGGSNSKPGKSDSAPSGGKPGGGGANGQSSQAGEPSGSPTGNSSQSGAGRLGDGGRGAKPARDGVGSPVGRGIPEGDGPGQGAKGEGGSGSDGPPPSAEPNLDELKEASNLVLQRLKGQLSRGEVDEETLQELGWKDLGQLKKFVSRLEEGLAESPDDLSPEAQARRRQFEEILKSLSLDAQTETRERGLGTERRVDQVDAGRRPVPSSLRERYEAYTRSLSKQGSSGKGAPKSPPPPTRGGPNR